HFGAVDWECETFIDGTSVGTHRGGYDGFSFDITDALDDNKEHEIIVSVWDPSDQGAQAVGKQHKEPRGIFYTPTSGIWQTVWLEPVPQTHIRGFQVYPDIDTGSLILSFDIVGNPVGTRVKAEASAAGKSVADFTGLPDENMRLTIPEPRLWSPEDPFLYDLSLTLQDTEGRTLDQADGYFGMRKISLGKDGAGITRLFFNNEFVFQLGPLDQGFWPDGLHTAPTDEALKYDIEVMKEMGFNMVRKHVKIEPARWYYWCDTLGLLVWQDMPSAKNTADKDKAQFEQELENLVLGRFNHPSIIMWVPFNEGWGQYDSERITDKVKALDPTRLVNHASGWTDRGVSDVHDIHNYPDPRSPEAEEDRAIVLGEFGGLGFNVAEHTWQTEGWGYDLLQDPESLVKRYENLYVQLLPLIRKPGLSAAVYTQISDIETENNGLLTYDRELNKMGAEAVALANHGFLPPLLKGDHTIFIDKFEVDLESIRPDAEIRYTTDGTDPTLNSTPFRAPFKVSDKTTIKAKAFWEEGKSSRTSTFELEKVPPREPVEPGGEESGLKVSHFEGEWRNLPVFDTLEKAGEFVSPQIDLNAWDKDRLYALKFEGYLEVPETGVYIFTLTCDDGGRLFIGDNHLIENDGIHGMREKSAAVALKAGSHPITLFYFQRTGGKGLKLEYSGPGIEKQVIPASVFKH
ncbi:PA14 domain-containing protein, partial [Acidobacteriota bacterium]